MERNPWSDPARRWLFIATALAALSASASQFVSFEAGQAWHYDTQEGEEESFLVIDAVRSDEVHGNTYLITVLRLHCPYPNCGAGGGSMNLAVSEAGLRESVTELIGAGIEAPEVMPDRQRQFHAGRIPAANLPVKYLVPRMPEGPETDCDSSEPA